MNVTCFYRFKHKNQRDELILIRQGEKVKFPAPDRLMHLASRDQLIHFDSVAYQILNQMGVFIDEKAAIGYFKDTPVEIDEKELVFKFPEWWVREMLRKAPSQYVLAGRDPKKDCQLSGPRTDFYTMFSAGATKQYLWNESTNHWDSSPTNFNDALTATKMIDAIDAYEGLFNSIIEDVESSQAGLPAELHAAYAKFKGTSKFNGPMAITEGGLPEWEYLGKMAGVVQGGMEELRKRPIIAGLPSAIGPMQSTRQNFWAAVGSAKNHIVTFPYWGGTAPFTAPATTASQIAMAIACCHYTMAVQEFLDPGAGTCPWPICTPVLPATGQLTNMPNFAWVAAISNNVYQDLYGLPVAGCAHTLTMSLEEVASIWFTQTLPYAFIGTNVIEFGAPPSGFMWESIPMGESIVNFVKQTIFLMSNSIYPEDQEALDLKMLMEVGPKGRFVTHPHTLKWSDPKAGLYDFSKDWVRDHSDKWIADGAKRWCYDTCRERLKELRKHEPLPLGKDVEERLVALVKEADEKLALF